MSAKGGWAFGLKKILYIILSCFLGFLFSILLHVIIEIPYLKLLEKDFYKWSFGFSYQQLVLIHLIYTLVLSVLGILFGLWLGMRWYNKLYK